MNLSKKQSAIYLERYEMEKEYFDKSQNTLYQAGAIPYAKKYDIEVKKVIKEFRLYYNILNEIQRQENKKTYLITLTSEYDLDYKVSKFIKALSNLKNLKSFKGLEFDYFSIIEPKCSGESHLHIKLVIDNYKGIYTKLQSIVSKLDFEYKSIKKQTIDKKNYLLKMINDSNYKVFVGWIQGYASVTLKKAVKRSRYIKISDFKKITLKEYKQILRTLLRRNPNKYIGLKEVKEHFLEKFNLYRILADIFKNGNKTIIIFYKSKQTLYNYIYQVNILLFLVNFRDLRNNSPTKLKKGEVLTSPIIFFNDFY